MSRNRNSFCLLLALGGLFLSSASHALRPFESTDADVVDPGEIELEAGILYEEQSHDRLWEAPTLVLNIGVLEETELVLEGVSAYKDDDSGTGWDRELTDTAAFVKRVWRRSEDGLWSFATETGILFPNEEDDQGLDYEALAIFTWNAPAASVHFNGGVETERELGGANRDTILFWGVAAEMPLTDRLQLAAEINGEKHQRERPESRALVGCLWQCRENLLLDLAVFRGLTKESPDVGFTGGFTYSF